MIDRRSAMFAALGGVAGALAIRAILEPRRLTVSSHIVRSTGTATTSARVVQLSDLHLRALGSLESQVISAVYDAQPDLIAITGDSISSRPALGLLDRFLARLEGVAPAVAVLGNWDRWSGATARELRAAYGRRGVTLLVNETMRVDVRGQPVRITGVDDLMSGQPTARAGLDAAAPGEMHLLLSHAPLFREWLWREVSTARGRAGWTEPAPDQRLPSLMLSGHTHGGQFRLLGFAPVRPGGSGRYVAGWYRDERPHLYVSRGLGTSAIRARLGAPPELAVFDIELPG